MIKKDRKIPIRLQKLDALLRRISIAHPKRPKIEENLAKYKAGYRGEQSLDYHLSFLPNDYLIFHDLRLQHHAYFFQIDTLVVTSSFILILEVKNLSGKITFDHSHHQLIRKTNEVEEVFPDPILQAKRQHTQLVEWLKEKKFPSIPVKFLVVVTNRFAHIISGNTQQITRSGNLLEKVEELTKAFSEDKFSKKDLRKVTNLLRKHHTPNNLDILNEYEIEESELIKGIYCPECVSLPMEKLRGKWKCPSCSHLSKEAYIHSLRDYSLLIKPTITNQQMREFLLIDSCSITRKLLAKLNLPHSGKTKGRQYELNSLNHSSH